MTATPLRTNLRCMIDASLTFRPALPTDAPAIRALVLAAYAKWVPVMGREPMPMTADYDMAVQKHQFRLAYQGDDLVGLIETDTQADHIWIENIAVRSDCQGRGIGQSLLRSVDADARELGLPEVRLLTNAALVSNIRMYQAFGFTLDRTEAFRGGFVVLMSKPV